MNQYHSGSGRRVDVGPKGSGRGSWMMIHPAPGEDWTRRGIYLEQDAAVDMAVNLLQEIAPEKLAPAPPRTPLGELKNGTFLRPIKGHQYLVDGVVKILPDEPSVGRSAPPEEYRVVAGRDGVKFTIYNAPDRTYWEPVEVKVEEVWTVVE